MDQDNMASVLSNVTHLSGKSWTAYLAPALLTFLAITTAVPLFWHFSKTTALIIVFVTISAVAYQILFLRSYRLFYNDDGIWIYSGILPWSKGIAGVKWRDLDEAVYFRTFWSWLFKSYSVRIGHRFTKSSEIFLTHMVRGHESVMTINQSHQDRIRSNALV